VRDLGASAYFRGTTSPDCATLDHGRERCRFELLKAKDDRNTAIFQLYELRSKALAGGYK